MILLDTCTLLWLIGAPEGLSPAARQRLESSAHEDTVHISAISACEIAQKVSKGKLILLGSAGDWWNQALIHAQIKEVPIDSRIALRAASLPPLHNDPFDRLIIATVQELRFTLRTPDPKIRAYPDVRVLW